MIECTGGHRAGKGVGRFGPCGERVLVLVFSKKFWEEVRKDKTFEIKTKEAWEPDLGVERNTSERRTRKCRAPMKVAVFVQEREWSLCAEEGQVWRAKPEDSGMETLGLMES